MTLNPAAVLADVADIMWHDPAMPRIVHYRHNCYLYEGGAYRKISELEICHRVIQYMAMYIEKQQ